MTNDRENDNLYSRFKGWQKDGFGHYKKHWAGYYRKELAALGVHRRGGAKRSLRLLEIGFGNGSFLGWARDQGHTVFGVEINALQLAASERAGFNTRSSLTALAAAFNVEELDGVVAFDVFEHLTAAQLIELLQELQRLLKPEGWILARFPNGDSPFGRLNQHGDLTHVTTLGSVAIRHLAVSSFLDVRYTGSPQTPILRIGVAHGVAAMLAIVIRTMFELPLQALLNAYYPGNFPRWYPLGPNMVARFTKPRSDADRATAPSGVRCQGNFSEWA